MMKEIYQRWRKNHPYGVKAQHHKVRSGKPIYETTIQMVYEDNIKQFGTLTCYLCIKSISFGLDCLEHKIPISRGGSNNYENLGVCHRECNSRKRTKTYKEFLLCQK